jgi:hypothetical protein
MQRRRQAPPPLSVHRAFVVHLGPDGSSRRRFRGRVEHLSSGTTAQFTSLAGLLRFFAIAAGSEPPRQKGARA